jgi:hypothetical protein
MHASRRGVLADDEDHIFRATGHDVDAAGAAAGGLTAQSASALPVNWK